MPIPYAHEKISNVIYSIVTSVEPLSLQERVYQAAFGTNSLSADDFPNEDIKRKFDAFVQKVTRVESKKDGSFRASADAMTADDARRALIDFMEIATDVESLYHEHYRRSA